MEQAVGIYPEKKRLNGRNLMADFTETDYAEDFLMELEQLIDKYLERGMEVSTVKMVFDIALDNISD